MKKEGYSDREIVETKVVRIFKEAYEQGALLTHSDVAYLLNVSTGTVSKQAKEYMQRTGEILPTRGIIHDIGRAVTHCQRRFNFPHFGRFKFPHLLI